MNRLQKKCVIASTGFHLLLAVILFVGPGFQSQQEKKLENLPPVDFSPIVLTDKQGQGGGNPTAKPPQPTPPVQPVVRPPPPPVEQPREKVQEKELPKETPREIKTTRIDPDSLETRTDNKHKIDVNLKPVNRDKDTRKAQKQPTESDTRVQEAKELADRRRQFANQLSKAADNIRANVASATAIEDFGPGGGGPAYANYAAWVKTKYENAWIPPDDAASDDAIAKVSVTIASDGTVMTARIIRPSGDAMVDRSVQRTLDAVTFVAPFPQGVKEKQRSYIINFNLKAKRGIG